MKELTANTYTDISTPFSTQPTSAAVRAVSGLLLASIYVAQKSKSRLSSRTEDDATRQERARE